MNRAFAGFLIETCFTVPLGVWIGRFIYITPRGIAMNAAAKAKLAAVGDRLGRGLDWIGHGRRLAALIVAIGFLVLAAYGYTYRSAQASNARSDEKQAAIFACVSKYVADLSKSNTPRTLASIEATNARFYWDKGHDPMHPTWSKDRLKAEYVRLFEHYQAVTRTNPPLPAFSASYCAGSKASPLPTTPTPKATAKPKKHHKKKAPASSSSSGGGATFPVTHPTPTVHGSGHSGGPRTHPKPTNQPTTAPLPGILLPGLPAPDLICAVLPMLCTGVLSK